MTITLSKSLAIHPVLPINQLLISPFTHTYLLGRFLLANSCCSTVLMYFVGFRDVIYNPARVEF